MIHTKFYRMHKGPHGLSAGGHHPWASRDYEEIDCEATGCMFNRGKKCMTPSICKIAADGRCEGFSPKPLPPVKDGD